MWAALYGGQTKSGRRRSLHRLLHGRQRSKLQRAGDDARRPHRPASLPRTHAVRHKQRDRAAPDTPQLPPDHQGKQAHGGVSRALDRPALPASMYAGERTWADVQRYIGACGTPGTPVATLRLGKTYHQVRSCRAGHTQGWPAAASLPAAHAARVGAWPWEARLQCRAVQWAAHALLCR